jgi:hypothetical protein
VARDPHNHPRVEGINRAVTRSAFWILACLAAALLYALAHEVFNVLDITIFQVSVAAAASLGAVLMFIALRAVWNDWL